MSSTEVPAVADRLTIEVYAAEAANYAERNRADRAGRFLAPFMAMLPPRGAVLDLGCGAGWAALVMQNAGFDVYALDACEEFAAIASAKLERPVRVQSFEELADRHVFDGVWASASLLHVAKAHLPPVLDRVVAALKPGGVLFASFKEGEGEARDRLGRFYAYYSVEQLRRVFENAGLVWDHHGEIPSTDFTGQAVTILGIFARSPARA